MKSKVLVLNVLMCALLVAGCQESPDHLDGGPLRKQEPFFDAINRKFEAEGGFAGVQGLSDGKRALVIKLSQTSIADSEIKLLERLTDIDEFDASNTELGDAIVDTLLRWPNLRAVNLSGTRITDAGAERLTELSRLEHLSMSATQVTDAVVKKLKLRLKKCTFDE